MQWICSAGGPLVLIPKSLRPRWQGTGGVPSDHEMACGVEGYAGVIEKARYQILVLRESAMVVDSMPFKVQRADELLRSIGTPDPGLEVAPGLA